MKDETLLYIAGFGALGYFVYKLGKPVQDTGAGVANAVTGLGSGISEIGTSTGDAVSDILSITDPFKAVTSKVTDLIENTPKQAFIPIPSVTGTTKTIASSILSLFKPKATATEYKPMQVTYGVNYNPFINPTSQSFFTENTPAGSVAALAIQNTTQLAKSDPIVKKAISNKIATPTGSIKTTSSTARYTGGVGKSSVTTKKK